MNTNFIFVKSEIEERTKNIESIKSVNVFPLNNLVIKGIIELTINENEYIADKLIYGDALNFIENLFFNYIIETKWI
jgi:hypothetical protein